jgi:hypothetical protein
MDSMKELNVPILKDSMDGDAAGAFWFLLSLDPNDETCSTSQNFYTSSRPNLHLLVKKQVIKLSFSLETRKLLLRELSSQLAKAEIKIKY